MCIAFVGEQFAIFLDVVVILLLNVMEVLSVSAGCAVVVCLPRPMEGMGRLQFSDLFTEIPVPPQAAGVDCVINSLKRLICFVFYNS